MDQILDHRRLIQRPEQVRIDYRLLECFKIHAVGDPMVDPCVKEGEYFFPAKITIQSRS